MNSVEILRRWRPAGRSMPVLILTALDMLSDKVGSIDAGADDYLTKPFQMPELLARVRALIRRSEGRADPVLHSGSIQFDTRTGTAARNGEVVMLTASERRLLQYLMHRAGKTVTRTEISEHINPQDIDRDSNTIEVFVRRLRSKLGPNSIETIRGQGYHMPLG